MIVNIILLVGMLLLVKIMVFIYKQELIIILSLEIVVVIMVLLVYIVGVIANNVGGKRLINYGESLLGRVPIVRPIYNSIKQIVGSFSPTGKTTFKRVVVVEFPMKGTRTIGFVTNESKDECGKKLLYIFIPTAPNPTSGFLQIVRDIDNGDPLAASGCAGTSNARGCRPS